MPSPFPGMDPYLEGRGIWPGLQNAMCSEMAYALNAVLPANFAARVDERVYIDIPDREIIPDVVIKKRPGKSGAGARLNGPSPSVAIGDEPVVVTLEPLEVREGFIEIIALDDRRRVVTVIELLSPSNKTAGSVGRRAYREKQREVLKSRANLVEIDLLKRGRHTVLTPVERVRTRGPFDQIISLSRARRRQVCETWPLTYRQRLATIRVPLVLEIPDIALDLQASLNRCYDGLAFDRQIDYREKPPIRLPRETREWIDALLREKGLRGCRSPLLASSGSPELAPWPDMGNLWSAGSVVSEPRVNGDRPRS